MARPLAAFDALVVAPECPYPVAGGGPNRTASIIEYLVARGRRVHVITFFEPGSPDARALFPAGVHVDLIPLRLHSKTAWARMRRNLGRSVRGVPPLVDRFSGYEEFLQQQIAGRRYETGVIEHFWCAPYVNLLRPHCRRLVLNLHNIDSVLLERCAVFEPFPSSILHRRFGACCRALESDLLPRFDAVLVSSAKDAQQLGRPAVVYPNAIPFRPQPSVEKSADLVFSGNLEYAPNVDAIRWFTAAVWPEIRARLPDSTWLIVGRNHERLERELRLKGVRFTGPVDDAVGTIASGRVAVVPLRAGSGTRVKILEAWAAGLPVVSTTIGAEGFSAGKALRLADTADGFIADVVALLKNAPDVQGRIGRAEYEKHYNWQAVWPILEKEGF